MDSNGTNAKDTGGAATAIRNGREMHLGGPGTANYRSPGHIERPINGCCTHVGGRAVGWLDDVREDVTRVKSDVQPKESGGGWGARPAEQRDTQWCDQMINLALGRQESLQSETHKGEKI